MSRATVHAINDYYDPYPPVRAGALVILSHGDYEDKGIATVLRVLRDFDPPAVVEEFLLAEEAAGRLERYGPRMPFDNPDWDPEAVGYSFCGWKALVGWLVERGLVAEVGDISELHVSGYGWAGW